MSLLAMEGLVAVDHRRRLRDRPRHARGACAPKARGSRRSTCAPPPARDGVLPLLADVTDQASVDAAVAAAVEQFGGIDVLVNNAASARRGTSRQNALDEWQRVFDVNVFGMVRRRARVPAAPARVASTGDRERRLDRVEDGPAPARVLRREQGSGVRAHPGDGGRPRGRGHPRELRLPRHRRHAVGRAAPRRADDADAARAASGRPPADRPARHRRGDRGRDRLPRVARGRLRHRQRAADRRRHPAASWCRREPGAREDPEPAHARRARPTSRTLAGSDAVHQDPDYSGAYVFLETDGPHEGVGMTFTIGARQRPVLRGDRAARAAGRRARARGARRRLGGVLAAAHQRRPAPVARSREGRDPPRDRGARERGVGPLGQDARASRCGSWSATCRPSSSSRSSTSATSPTCSTATRRSTCCARSRRRKAARIAELRPRRLSRVPHVGGLARLRRGEGARPVPRGARRRLAVLQDQGRRRRRGRRPPLRGDARGDRRPPAHGRREPGVGRRRGDRVDAAPRAVRPALDRGADEPRRRARPRRDPPRGRAGRRRDRRARREPRASSSSCCRPRRSTTARSTRAGSAA